MTRTSWTSVRTLSAILLGIALASLPAGATETCVPTSADPSTYNSIGANVNGEVLYYVEERDGISTPVAAVPLSGFLVGERTWIYEETNLVNGLQRGGFGVTGGCLPHYPLLCIVWDVDPITDVVCEGTHTSDRLIV